jgi:hypothetical protein
VPSCRLPRLSCYWGRDELTNPEPQPPTPRKRHIHVWSGCNARRVTTAHGVLRNVLVTMYDVRGCESVPMRSLLFSPLPCMYAAAIVT